VITKTKSEINAELEQLAKAVDSKNFAESVLSWDSTAKWTQGRSVHRTWLQDRFETQDGLDRSRMHPPITLSFDLIPWSRASIDVLDKAQEAADFAPVEAVWNFVLSSLVGLATESVVKSLGSVDSNGNPSTASSNTATAAGFGVGIASDMLTTEVIGSARSLKQSIDSLVQSNLRSMKSGGKHSSTWELPMMNCAL